MFTDKEKSIVREIQWDTVNSCIEYLEDLIIEARNENDLVKSSILMEATEKLNYLTKSELDKYRAYNEINMKYEKFGDIEF